MAKVKIQGHATGTGIITITAPNTNTNRTLTLPDADLTLGTPEGTAILSTGESGGTKFLREDGDGTCSWQAAGGAGGGVMEYISTQTLSSAVTEVQFDLTATSYAYYIIKAYNCSFNNVSASGFNAYAVQIRVYGGAYNSSSPNTNKLNLFYLQEQSDNNVNSTNDEYAQNIALFTGYTPTSSAKFSLNAEIGGKHNALVKFEGFFVDGTNDAAAPRSVGIAPNTSANLHHVTILTTGDFASGTFLLYGIKDS